MYNNFNAATFWQLAQENLHFSWLKSQQFGGDKFHQNVEKGHSLVKVTKKKLPSNHTHNLHKCLGKSPQGRHPLHNILTI